MIVNEYEVHNSLIFSGGLMPKKRCLGPQNGSGSSRPKKLLKIVKCVIINETEKMKETMVGPQEE